MDVSGCGCACACVQIHSTYFYGHESTFHVLTTLTYNIATLRYREVKSDENMHFIWRRIVTGNKQSSKGGIDSKKGEKEIERKDGW